MYRTIKTISVPSLRKFKENPFLNINHFTGLEYFGCATLRLRSENYMLFVRTLFIEKIIYQNNL